MEGELPRLSPACILGVSCPLSAEGLIHAYSVTSCMRPRRNGCIQRPPVHVYYHAISRIDLLFARARWLELMHKLAGCVAILQLRSWTPCARVG